MLAVSIALGMSGCFNADVSIESLNPQSGGSSLESGNRSTPSEATDPVLPPQAAPSPSPSTSPTPVSIVGIALEFHTQPSANATAGTNFATQPVVRVVNSQGNVDSDAGGTVMLAPYIDSDCSTLAISSLSGDSAPILSGVATFSSVSFTQSGPLYLKATSSGLTSACSSLVSVSAAASSTLLLSTQPSATATAGSGFSVQPVIEIQDIFGNVTSTSETITLSAYLDSGCTSLPASGSLSGSSTPAVAGTAAFSSVSYTKAETIYLKASSGSLTIACSQGIAVSPGAASEIQITTQPSASATAGASFSTQPSFKVVDAWGNTVISFATNITLSAYTNAGCSIAASGTLSNATVTPSSGNASLSTLNYTLAETIYLKATGGSVSSSCSNAIAVSAASAAKLAFQTQPSVSVTAGSSLLTAPTVVVQDNYGNFVASASDSITLAAYSNSDCSTAGTGALSAATNPLGASSGSAAFSSVSYTKAGPLYFKASAAGRTSACSSQVTVHPTTMTTLEFSTPPSSAALANQAFATQPTVAIKDTYGNLGTTIGYSITLSAYSDAACTIAGMGALSATTNPMTTSSGQASFSGVRYTKAGTLYLKAQYSTLSVCSSAITITPEGPTKLAFLGHSTTGTPGFDLALQPSVAVQDSNGNTISGSSDTITLSGSAYTDSICSTPAPGVLTGGGASGTSSGVASFSGVRYSQSGTIYLKATSSGGYASACSRAILLNEASSIAAANGTGDTAHTCQVTSSGAVRCWGFNRFGQLGDGTVVSRSTSAPVSGLAGVAISVAAGTSHTCALMSGGTVKCWGYNGYGQIGDNTLSSRSTPVSVLGISSAVSIAAGGFSSCAVLSDGSARCWGYNGNGQLGDGTITNRNSPVTLPGVANAVSITGGNGFFCALLKDGTARCWGDNDFGQLGNGSNTDSSSAIAVGGLSEATSLHSGNFHTCAVLADGNARCWGRNYWYQLGDGGFTDRPYPVPVSGLSGVASMAVGGDQSCAILSNGTAKCWGLGNQKGRLGDNTNAYSSATPVSVTGVSTAVAISVGYNYGCVSLSSGAAQCWGQNTSGQLGNGLAGFRTTPAPVSALSSALSVTAGASSTCSVLSDGTGKCWGANSGFQLGDGSSVERPSPTSISGLTNATDIQAGDYHSCALINDGSIKCWGANYYGGIGDGTTTPRSAPVSVSGAASMIAVSVGMYHGCGLSSAGAVSCWGDNYYGQIGDGTTTQRNTMASVSGLSGAVSISAGTYHTCALLVDGTARCWGFNFYGQLGNNTTANSSLPVTVSGLSDAVEIKAGSYTTCARLSSGSVKCWGYNGMGTLGDGTFTSKSVPTSVSGIASAISLGSAKYTSCAVLAGGAVQCWGDGYYGQLASGSLLQSNAPISIGSIANATSVAGGNQHVCARLSDSTIQCWGTNTDGQLGTGTDYYELAPVNVL